MHIFYSVLKFPELFTVRYIWEKSAGNFNNMWNRAHPCRPNIFSPLIISHFTAQRFCYEHSLFKSQRFCLRFQYFSYIFAQPWTFFTFLSLMISVDVFSLSTNRDKLRIISNVVFVAKFSNLAIKRCKELGLKITRSLCTEFTFAW